MSAHCSVAAADFPKRDPVQAWYNRYTGDLARSRSKDALASYAAFRKALPEAMRMGKEELAFHLFLKALGPAWERDGRSAKAVIRRWVEDARQEKDEGLRVWYSYHFNDVRGVQMGGTTLEHFKIRPGENLEVAWADPEYGKPPSATLLIEVARMTEDSAGRPSGFRPWVSGPMVKDWYLHRFVRKLEAPGVYRVCVVDREFFQQSYIQVGWLDLALKDDGTTLLAWVSSPRDTLKPPYRLRVTGAGGIDRLIPTDSDGLATVDLPKDIGLRNSVRIRAEKDGKDGNAAYVRGTAGLPAEGYWSWNLYTDRPRYRPGDRIHFRGIVKRQSADGSLGDGWTGPVELEIRDAKGMSVFRRTAAVDPWGLFGDSLLIPDEPALGEWRFEARGIERQGDPSPRSRWNLPGRWGSMEARFKVEAYRKPDFELKVKAELQAKTGKVRLSILGRYYSGGPLAGVPVEVRWQWDAPWRYAWFGGRGRWDFATRSSGDCLRRDTLILDRHGLAISEFVPASPPGWQVLTAEAIARDASGREVREMARAPLVGDTGLVNIFLDRFRYEAGDRANARILCLRKDGQPMAGKVRVRTLRDGAAWKDTALTLGADGTAELRFYLDRPGQYLMKAELKTGAGREMTAEAAMLVVRMIRSGIAPALALRPDKARYRPGDTARIGIRGGGPGSRILVTLEGEGLKGYQVIKIPGAAEALATVPLAASGLNGRIGVLVDGFDGWERDSLRVSMVDSSALLHAVLESGKSWKPGDRFQGRIRVLDRQGRPARARLSIGVVDEALYAEGNDDGSSVLDLLPTLSQNRVRTRFGESADDFLWALAGKRSYPMPPEPEDGSYGYGDFGYRRYRSSPAHRKRRGAAFLLAPAYSRYGISYLAFKEDTSYVVMHLSDVEKNGSEAPRPRERNVFKDEALWIPSATTGAGGEVDFGFTVPDDLTRWRISAKGAGAGAALIEFQDTLSVRLSLSARLRAPRQFVVGDSLDACVLLQNSTLKALEAHVRLEKGDSTRLAIGDSSGRTVPLPKGTSKVTWPLRPVGVGPASLRAVLTTSDGGDAEARVFPVAAPGLPRILSAGRLLSGGNGTDSGHTSDSVELDLTDGIFPGSAHLDIEAASQAILLLRSALDPLIQYPYGCVEQTLNRFVPLLQVADAMGRAGMKDDGLREKVRDYAAAGLDRLESMQGYSGGWGWWGGERFDLRMTILVVEGLSLARNTVLPESLSLRAQAMQAAGARSLAQARADSKLSPETLASLMHALFLSGFRTGYEAPLDTLYAARARLSDPSLALAMECLHLAGRKSQAKEALGMLESKAIRSGGLAWWSPKEGRPDGPGWEVENNAIIIRSLAACAPGHPLLPMAERWLYGRKHGDGWGYTRATAAAISALTRLSGTHRVPPRGSKLAVTLNGKPVRTISVEERSDGPFRSTIALDAGALDTMLLKGKNRLGLALTGAGRLFWSARLRYADGNPAAKSGSGGFRVSRWYRKAIYRPAPGGWVRRTVLLKDRTVRLGDEIEVSVLVTSDTARDYMMVEDFFPAGLEYLDRTEAWMSKYAERWFQDYDHKEARDDRMAFFLSHVPKGNTLFTYLLRAETPGSFVARPARAELMYEPEISANSRQDTVRVTK